MPTLLPSSSIMSTGVIIAVLAESKVQITNEVLNLTQPKLKISGVWCVYFLTESPDKRAGGGVVAVGETTESTEEAEERSND